MPSETCTEPALAHTIQRSCLGMQRFPGANRQHRGAIFVLTDTCNGGTVISSSWKAKKLRPQELRGLYVSALCGQASSCAGHRGPCLLSEEKLSVFTATHGQPHVPLRS